MTAGPDVSVIELKSAEDAKHDGADEGKRDIRGHDTQPADGHGKLPVHVTARI